MEVLVTPETHGFVLKILDVRLEHFSQTSWDVQFSNIMAFKRVLQLGRCMRKGWDHYAATVGATVFAHNLLVLARC